MTMLAKQTTATLSSCCSAFYEQDWVRQLAEDSFHPGGADLTRHTITAMDLQPNARLLDLGCGVGTTAIMLFDELGYAVTGIDLSASNVEHAIVRAGDRSTLFVQGDAHALPFEDSEFDGVIAECVVSLLANRPAALAEVRRVLKPNGRVGLTDMSVSGELPADIAEVIAPWTCLVDALDQEGYRTMFEAAGFDVAAVVDESAGLKALLDKLKRKLLLIGARSLAADVPMPDLATLKTWLDQFEYEISNGSIRYLRYQLQPFA